MKNYDIYQNVVMINQAFPQDVKLPIKLNFYLHKNLDVLSAQAKLIEESRTGVGEKYGELDGDNGYKIPIEHMVEAQKELEDLMEIENDIHISKIKFSDIPEDLILTSAQMEALMFMIDDEEKED